jgi:hypothetical protein
MMYPTQRLQRTLLTPYPATEAARPVADEPNQLVRPRADQEAVPILTVAEHRASRLERPMWTR